MQYDAENYNLFSGKKEWLIEKYISLYDLLSYNNAAKEQPMKFKNCCSQIIAAKDNRQFVKSSLKNIHIAKEKHKIARKITFEDCVKKILLF